MLIIIMFMTGRAIRRHHLDHDLRARSELANAHDVGALQMMHRCTGERPLAGFSMLNSLYSLLCKKSVCASPSPEPHGEQRPADGGDCAVVSGRCGLCMRR